MFRRGQVKRQRLPGSYRDPHPSISDTSMWDKSIMCLCSNCKGVTEAVGVTTRLRSLPRSLKAMFTCGSSSGSSQRARDWRIWPRLSSAGGTWRTSVAEKTTGWGLMRRQGALEDHMELQALFSVGVLTGAPYLYGTDGPEQVPQLHVCGGGGEAFYGDSAPFVACSPLVLSAGRRTPSTHRPTSATSTPARHHDLHPKAGVRPTTHM